jgi:hypothetical protein
MANLLPGANPTIVRYSASAAKLYNATSSLVRFESKHFSWLQAELLNTLQLRQMV